MKPVIPPLRGIVHKALSEGCSMWAPVVLPVGKSNLAEHQAEVVKDATRIVNSVSNVELESAATAAGKNPPDLFSAHQSKKQRNDKQDDEYKEQDLGNFDCAGGNAGKAE